MGLYVHERRTHFIPADPCSRSSHRRRPRSFPTAEPGTAGEGPAAKDAEKAEDRQEKKKEEQQRELETKKLFAEAEKMTAETKMRLAEKVSTLNAEQLAAYNRTLDEANRPAVRYMPVYLPYYGYPTSYYGRTQWRGW